jgi:hypothetical protein
MADYFTNFSFILRLPDTAAQTYALELHQQAARIHQGDESWDGFPVDLAELTEDWCFEVEPTNADAQPALWLHSQHGGIDAVCGYIHHLLQKFSLISTVTTFEWSHDCSKPRVDAYGGGAAVVTAHEIKTMSTCEWLRKHAR